MERKNIAGLITIVAIVSVAIFAGCVENEEVTPSTPTPITPTPKPTLSTTPTPAYFFGAFYSSNSINIGKIDLDDIIVNAKDSRYSVEQKMAHSGGLQPTSYIKGLNEKLGDNYTVTTVHYNCNDVGLALSINDMPRGETSITLTFHELSSFPLDEEVPEDWVLEMLMLSFNMKKQEAGNYVIALKNNLKSESGENNELQPTMVWIEDGETKESKVGFPKIWIKERPDIKAIYEYLNGRSTSSNLFFYYPGSYEEDFYIDDEWVGSMNYLIPLITITKIDREHAYYLNIDTKGIISIDIKLKEIGKEIPESEYTAVLEEMFVNLGLATEWINRFDFYYYPGHA